VAAATFVDNHSDNVFALQATAFLALAAAFLLMVGRVDLALLLEVTLLLGTSGDSLMLRTRTLFPTPTLFLVADLAGFAHAALILVGKLGVISKPARVQLFLATALFRLAELAGFTVTLRLALIAQTFFAHASFLLAKLVELALLGEIRDNSSR